MLRGAFPDAGEDSPAELQAAYADLLADTVESVGIETVTEATELDRDRVEAVRQGSVGELTVAETASILATDPDRPDAETLLAEARDILLMGMTTAVLDVESLSSAMDGRLEPKALQQKVEGRRSMTLAEYALVHHHLEAVPE